MINDFFKPYRIFGIAAFITAVAFAGFAQAQNYVPDSIQLNDEIPAYGRLSTPVQAPVTQVQYQEVIAAPAPNTQAQVASPMAFPNAPAQGTPAYTPDGTAPVMESAPVMDGAVMETSCDGLFLGDFCAPVCQPSCGGILGPGCLFVEGWVDQGFNVNSNKTTSSNLPMATDDCEGYMLNQLYLSFGRRVIKADQWALGGQVDIMYGTDYYYMTSTGLETTTDNSPHVNGQQADPAYRAYYAKYGLALPQFFAEIYAPILNGVDVKIGHFNSVMGFESNQATQNFFYSRSYQSVYGMPTTMTGVITDWKIGECWSIIAGGVNEWNAYNTSGDDDFSFVVGATYENLCGNFAVSAIVMNGKQKGATFMPVGYPAGAYDTTIFNLILKYKFTDRLAYVGEFTYGNNDAPVWDESNQNYFRGRNWYGFSNYLFYVVNEHVTFGARFEWFQDKEDTVMTGGNRVTFAKTPANYFAWSFGVNWDPFTWLTIRPEVRWDYSDLAINGNSYAFDNGDSKTLFTFGCDAIVRF